MKLKTTLMLAVSMTAALTVAPVAHAWDSFGHMTVAYLAYQQLTPQTKQRANDLIKLNPYYTSTWTAWIPSGTSQADTDTIMFMLSATWPDQIKDDKNYSSDGSQNGDNPEGSTNATANVGFQTDFSMHKYWHFVDTPFSPDGTHLPAIPTPNAQDRITLFRSVLSSDSSDQLKSYDLTWLLHLVGDVHQPLHCATRAISTESGGDSGGNDVKLNGGYSELHAFWDDVLGTGTLSSEKLMSTVKSVEKAAAKLSAPDATLAAKTSETDWVTESFNAAQTNVYITPIGPDLGPFTLTTSYKTAAKKVAGQRIALAGARLANLLNNKLK